MIDAALSARTVDEQQRLIAEADKYGDVAALADMGSQNSHVFHGSAVAHRL